MVRKKVSKRKKQDDFSNKTVVVMLILVIVVSVISLSFYIYSYNTLTSSPTTESEDQLTAQGQVSLQIINPEDLKNQERNLG